MNRQGPQQQMRLFPPAGATGRGALPNASGWQGTPPPGVPTPGNRPNSTLTFSQSVGGLGSQPSTPLDMSEFPALGGQPQTNSAQAWNRLSNQPSTQARGPQQHPPPPHQGQPPQQSQQGLPQHDSFAQHKGIFGGGMDSYRIGGSTGVGGGGGDGQPQRPGQVPASSAEDFPALPTSQQSIGQLDERGMGLGPMGQRPSMSLEGGRILPGQLDSIPQQRAMVMGELEKKVHSGQLGQLNGAPGLSAPPSSTMSHPLGQPSHPSPAPGLEPPRQQPKFPPSLNGADFGDSQSSQGPASSMSESDRWGFTGLLSLIRNENSENSAIAVGQDLTLLGLDLSQPDSALWPSFASPFAELESKAVEPEFHLPTCYTVHNTQPVLQKIQNFSDETLFFIFYSMPRDLMQEVVVAELAARNWRYHMLHRLWMTKDNSTAVEQFSETAEKGIYIFFDPTSWERVRKEIILEYNHLDPRTTGTYNAAPITGGLGPLPGSLPGLS